MQTSTEKSQEKKHRSPAGDVAQEKRQGDSLFQFADNRPEAMAQRKLQEMAGNSPRAGQLKALQEKAGGAAPAAQLRDSSRHVDKNFQAAAADKHAVVQGKFAGTFGGVLSALTPAALGASGTYYNTLWNALNSSATVIAVENAGGMANFNPATNTLSLKSQALNELLAHRGGNLLPPAVLADHIALITHELSHAHDSVVLGKELKGEHGTAGGLAKIFNVMMTEVQAWEERLGPGRGCFPTARTIRYGTAGSISIRRCWSTTPPCREIAPAMKSWTGTTAT